MLLLVLIFVFVAFGMLLVALVTGTATWAWVSVAVSVAAAGVLVYDWTQRRAAISDGDRIALPVRDPSPHADPANTAFAPSAPSGEPATEAIQPLRGTPPQWTTQVAQRARRDDHAPAAPPPGSSQQPPSAAPGTGTSDWERSQPVTVSGAPAGTESPSSDVTPSDDARSSAQSGTPAPASAA
ncbi:MAG TPA: hypothetical protein VL595_03055, partial [Pseudonocardia sp.]|nr:hypothetical protein [Pseudonocardia sp.]